LARPREFDEEKALDAAVDCFWKGGLDATTIRDLAEQMGINGPSLYNAFGDKRALFAQALERYVTVRVRERLARLEAETIPRRALEQFFAVTVEGALADPEQRGCLIINSALALGPDDAGLRPQISGYLDEIEAFFRRQLEAIAATPEGTRLVASPVDGARLLLSALIGLRVLGRVRPERAVLESIVRAAFQSIGPPLAGTYQPGSPP